MIARDIFQDAKAVLGQCSESTIFSRLTDAVETLANKGQWEPLLGYYDAPVNAGNLVSLPRDVEMPIRVNVDNTPSYARDRLYEFTLNGPGPDSPSANWSWEDRGTTPTFIPLTAAMADRIKFESTDAADNGKLIRIYGTGLGASEISETMVLNSAVPQTTSSIFTSITRISKDVTAGLVNVYRYTNGAILSTYYGNDTEPFYRQIRLSKTGVTARVLFRRRTFVISSQDDFIPLHSKMAILMMLKANDAYRKGSIEQMALGQAYEKQALAFLKEEQDSRNTFAELAAQDDQPIYGLNVNNRDSIIAADVYDDAVKIFGKEGMQRTLDRISESVEALANKSQWDGMDGYIDIATDEDTITLPRYVETPISVNTGGRPAFMRNKWFEFHLNGPGSDCGGSVGWAWDDRGEVVTLKDVDYEQQLIAIPDLSEDNGKYIRIFGYDADDKWIRSTNPNTGKDDDGFWVMISQSVVSPDSGSQKVSRIERITKDITKGFVSLSGFDTDGLNATLIGYYWPDETEPRYRRIRVGCSCDWVRMRYRKRTRKITSLTDPIHLQSKLSVVTMMMSLAALGKGDVQTSEMMEQKAGQYLSEEQMTRSPAEVFSFQFDTSTSWADPLQGIR